MSQTEKWIYIYSDSLKMKIAFQEDTGRIVCEDKTQYSMKEIEIVYKAEKTIELCTHLCKKVFMGEIVGVEVEN
jgi:hypothetical protein